MNLYDIAEEFAALEDMLNSVDEEGDNEAMQQNCHAAIESMKLEKEETLLNLWRWIRNAQAEAEATKAEKMRLERRQRVLNGRVEWLKALVVFLLGPGNAWSQKDGIAGFKWRRSKGVVIEDSRVVPDAWCRIERVPVLAEIKKTIEEGGFVPGAVLQERNNLQVK